MPDLRIHLQGVPSSIRGTCLWQGKSGVPEVPHQETGTATLSLRGIRQRFVGLGGAVWCLRILRRSSRAGRLLDAGHELGPRSARILPVGPKRTDPHLRCVRK